MDTPGLFVTGTDTAVGKTYVTAMIARESAARGIRVGAYKPACSGSIDTDGGPVWEDVEMLRQAIGTDVERRRICPQCLRAPLAPPIAARLEHRTVDSQRLREGARWWEGRVDLLLVEGAGGLLCPLTEREPVADLAADLGFPLLVVARLGLGTINHTLLTIEAARSRGLAVAGIVMNESEPQGSGRAGQFNPGEIASRCDVPVLGVVTRGGAGLLRDGRLCTIDWLELANR